MISDGFKIGDITLRTLEQLVLKNKEDIANHYNRDRVLADFGIHVIGLVETASLLPVVETPPQFDYGDAYVVGTSEPYSIYVFTRADLNSGHPDPYFLDIGPIAAEGPVGPTGPVGPQGPRGFTPRWFAGNSANIQDSHYPTTEEAAEGVENFFLDTATGVVTKLYKDETGTNRRSNVGNIRGPQGIEGPQGKLGEQGPRGIQGPRGPQGPVANVVEILGIVYSIDSLPDPSTVSSNSAYLYKHLDVTNIYIIIDGSWVNAGNFGGGSAVTVNGLFVQDFDADSKVNVRPLATGPSIVYASRGVGNSNNPNAYYYVTTYPKADSIPIYNLNTTNYETAAAFDKTRCLYTGDPQFDYHCVPKKYVDALHQSIPQHYIDFVIKNRTVTEPQDIIIDLRGTPLENYTFGAFKNPQTAERLRIPMMYIEMRDNVPYINQGLLYMFGDDNKIKIESINTYYGGTGRYDLFEEYKTVTLDDAYMLYPGYYHLTYTPSNNANINYDIHIQIPLIKLPTT